MVGAGEGTEYGLRRWGDSWGDVLVAASFMCACVNTVSAGRLLAVDAGIALGTAAGTGQ